MLGELPGRPLLATPLRLRLRSNGRDHIPGVGLSHCTCRAVDSYLLAKAWGSLGRKSGKAHDVTALHQGGCAQELKQAAPSCSAKCFVFDQPPPLRCPERGVCACVFERRETTGGVGKLPLPSHLAEVRTTKRGRSPKPLGPCTPLGCTNVRTSLILHLMAVGPTCSF